MYILRNVKFIYSKQKLLETKRHSIQILRKNSVLIDNFSKIMTIGINRPIKKNAIDKETFIQLKEAIVHFENNKEFLVCVLHGIGGNFCSGFDIDELEKEDFVFPQNFSSGHFFKKPIIAAIDGFAVAGGFELALMCDLRVMEETAKIGFLSRRFGFPIMNGGSLRLQKMIGLSRAMDLVLTGRLLNAEDAFNWGIVNRFVGCGTAKGQAINLAESLVKFQQDCLLHDRNSLYFNTYVAKDTQEAIEFEKTYSSNFLNKEFLRNIKDKFDAGVGKHGKFKNIT